MRGKAGSGLESEAIGPVFATPVCRRDFAKRLRSPCDLTKQTPIEMRSVPGSWARYLEDSGVPSKELRILSLESYFETLTATERGLGVTFGLFPMTSEWVQNGRLAVPFAARMPVEGGLYLVYRELDPRRGLFVSVADWLREEYSNLAPLPDGRTAC